MTKSSSNGHATFEPVAKPEVKVRKVKAETPGAIGIILPKIDIKRIVFEVVGTAPLIVNCFSQKAKKEILDTQMKVAKKGREAKNPKEMFENSLYKFPDGKKTGFTAIGFKCGMVRAGMLLGMPMTQTRCKFHVIPDDMANDGTPLIEIKGKYIMREDAVRLQNGSADLRYRACYPKWSANVTIQYNATWISEEQIANLLNHAGFACGIGEWRPEKGNGGMYGMYAVAG